MDGVLLIGRLVLAAVFLVAGVGKLLDLRGSAEAMRGFGVPARLARPLGFALPVAELVVGGALLFHATAWWAAVAGLALLLAFLAGIGYQLARGRQPDCHCFGQIHSAPVGRATLGRNGVLAAIAALVAIAGIDDAGPGAFAWLGNLDTVEAVVLALVLVNSAVVAGLVWAVLHLVSQNGRLLLRLDAIETGTPVPAPVAVAGTGNGQAAAPAGLPVGTAAPGFSLQGMHGETLTLDALRAPGRPVLLLFSDPGCGPCNALLPEVAGWQRDHGSRLTIALVSRGGEERNHAKVAEHSLVNVLLQRDREVAERYQAQGTPMAALVRPDGTIGSALVGGADAIRALVESVTSVGTPSVPVVPMVRPTPPVAARPNRVGQPAPAVALPDLANQTVRLADFRGEPVLALFWNPGCGFCQRMLPDLKAWETNRPPDAPRLLVISTGDAEANRAQGLAAPVLLESGFVTGQAFGAGGTPSAVLIDAEGRIASDVAVGAQGVLALAGADPRAASA